MAFCSIEILFSPDHSRIVHITSGRHSQSLHIQIHIFHIFRRYIQLVISQSHHTPLIDLCLSFTDLLRITAIGHSHITRKTEFYRQVGMLSFITGYSQRKYTPFVDIITPPTDPIFRIITFCSQSFDLSPVERHNLPHTDMP